MKGNLIVCAIFFIVLMKLMVKPLKLSDLLIKVNFFDDLTNVCTLLLN